MAIISLTLPVALFGTPLGLPNPDVDDLAIFPHTLRRKAH
jgi:hypothetical protein